MSDLQDALEIFILWMLLGGFVIGHVWLLSPAL
jgi:hypothetical protein